MYTLAFVAESSTNEVQAIDETNGALVGAPIAVGSSPQGIAYWRPPTSGAQNPDVPEVVATNAGDHSVTVIDAQTRTVVATVQVPGGSATNNAAASPGQPYVLAVDGLSGKISVINLSNNTDSGEVTLTGTTNYVLTDIAFSASGAYAYVTDPSQHKIFVLQTSGTTPYYSLLQTYTNSAINPTSVATDTSSSSSSALFVTNAQSSSGSLLKFNDASGTLSSPTTVKTFSSTVPGAVSVSPDSTDAWVAMTGTKTVAHVVVSSGSTSTYTVNSSFTGVGPLALSADGATLLTADTGSALVQGTSATSGTATNATTTDGTVSNIAPALAIPGAWNAYVTAGNYVKVLNTTTQSIVQSISDSNTPAALVASPDGQYVYAANSGTASVSVIQTSLVGSLTNPVVATISIPQSTEPHVPKPYGIAINPAGTELLVTDIANGAVYVIDMNPSDSQYKTVIQRIGLSGSGNSSSWSPNAVQVGPDGSYAYVSEQSSGGSTDGIVVLQATSSTTTGYTFDAADEALVQGSTTMIGPSQFVISPNGETAYVNGQRSSDLEGMVFSFPLGTNGQLSNGTGSPVDSAFAAEGLAYSPEDDSVYFPRASSYGYSSYSLTAGTHTYDSATTNFPVQVAVSPDGLYVAIAEQVNCSGSNEIGLYDAGSGTKLADVGLGANVPGSIAFVPKSSPQTITTAELAGGASNPAEAAVSGGMNNVVSSGTPADAPGASGGVDTATGAYSMSVDSMTIPDIGIPLDMSASYDSSRASTSGLLGNGWQYSYGITASQNAHNASTNPCAIVVTQENGSTVTFFPSAQGPYTTCPGSNYAARGWVQATLSFATNCNGTDSCFVMTRNAAMKYYIDETNGELVKESDLNGNSVTITWGSHTACAGATSTQPCQVTAADGTRTLTFSYPSAGSGTCPTGSTACIVVTDPLGRTLTYVENSSGQLTSITLANSTASATYAFTYASGSLLSSWWDPSNYAAHSGSTTYATDVTWTSGRATQVTGPPIASVAPLSTTAITPTATFTYAGFTGTSGNGTVLITNPDFNQSNYEPGASQTLDTYAGYQLVSSVVGYGSLKAYYNGSTAPVVPVNPSESAYPARDNYTLQPTESMNALAGTTVPSVGTQTSQYDPGISLTTYDASGNAILSVDPSGNTTSSTYNPLNEIVTSTDGLGNVTTNSYNSTGQLLTTKSPPNASGNVATTSNWYNSNGTPCASRDGIETNSHGAVTSCVSAGSNATTYSYDSSGDQTLSTVTNTTTPSTVTSTTQSVYDAGGNVCATLSPDGYAIGALSSCPSSGSGYATVNLNPDVYNHPTKVVSSLTIGSPNTYATSYTCTDANGNTTASVGPRGSFSTCAALSPTTSVDAAFRTFDASGDLVQSTSPLAVSGTQGPTSTSLFDAIGSTVRSLSTQGYAAWVANNSVDLTPYETSTLSDTQGNQVSTAPAADNVASCVDNASNPCPDTSITTYDNQGQTLAQASAGNGQSGSTAPRASTTTTNPDGTAAGGTSKVGGGTSGVSETSQSTYNAAGQATNSVSEHWNGSAWVTDSAASTAIAPDGSTCWTSQTAVTSPTCSSPPSSGGTTTTDYYDLAGHVVAQVGPGGSGTVEPGARATRPPRSAPTRSTRQTSAPSRRTRSTTRRDGSSRQSSRRCRIQHPAM